MWKNLLCVICCQGNNQVMNPFGNFCWLYLFFRSLFVLTIFYYVSIFNRFFLLALVMIIHSFIDLHVWLPLITVRCLTCWTHPTNVRRVDILNIRSVSYLQRSFMSYLFGVWRVGHYLWMVRIHQYSVRIHSIRNGTLLPLFFLTS